MICQKSFKHGWYYHYRIHEPKTAELACNNYSALKDFLYDMMENCPNEHFESGPRGSALKFAVPVKMKEDCKHEVCTLTTHGLEVNATRYKSAHSKVQIFMLEHDKKTISVEVPIWLNASELKGYKELFESEEPLTGHIDVLRVEDGKIWVWDYKPNAHKEKYAMTQTYFYALMLSKRTGIPIENFRCGYFDDCNAYTFKPKEGIIKEKQSKLI